DISKSQMIEEGEQIAEEVVKEIREIEGVENVQVMLALFREEEQSSTVPSNFVQKAVVVNDKHSIGKWESSDEVHVLFPSSKATNKYHDDYEKVKTFGEKIAEYFPNYVGTIGDGFYIDGNLTRLSIEIPLEFYGKGEVIGFTQ